MDAAAEPDSSWKGFTPVLSMQRLDRLEQALRRIGLYGLIAAVLLFLLFLFRLWRSCRETIVSPGPVGHAGDLRLRRAGSDHEYRSLADARRRHAPARRAVHDAGRESLRDQGHGASRTTRGVGVGASEGQSRVGAEEATPHPRGSPVWNRAHCDGARRRPADGGRALAESIGGATLSEVIGLAMLTEAGSYGKSYGIEPGGTGLNGDSGLGRGHAKP
jgi:hypothetical protein